MYQTPRTIILIKYKSKNKNPICGDEKIRLIVKNNKIVDIGYQCKSCVYCQLCYLFHKI